MHLCLKWRKNEDIGCKFKYQCSTKHLKKGNLGGVFVQLSPYLSTNVAIMCNTIQ